MKKLLAGVLALTMALSMCACSKDDDEVKDKTTDRENISENKKPESEDDSLVMVYQRVSATHYLEDGSKGYRRHLYTYDDSGNLLAIETDKGPESREIIDHIEVLVRYPFDGTINSSTYYLYTPEGHIRYMDRVEASATEEGKLRGDLRVSSDVYYTYLADGRIDTVEIYKSGIDGPLYDEPTISYKCSYNKKKQIVSCVCTTPVEGTDNYFRLGDWEYDEQGRLIEERYYHQIEGTRCYRYTYNNQGLLATAEYGRVNMDCYGNLNGAEEEFVARYGSFHYTYDETGRMIDSENNSIRYDSNGRLIAYDEATIIHNADGSKKICKGDEVYEFDQYGNLIRYPGFDEGYYEVEYRAIWVTKSQAERLERHKILRSDRDSYNSRSFLYEFMATIDFPAHPLHEYDLLLSGRMEY